MLTLNDGRSELWQWDTGRTLAVDADCSQVHFSNKVFGRSIDVDVADGVAIVPDVLLQTDKELNVWAFVGTAENGYTKISKTFKVNRRNKPADYVFTPPEQTTLAELVGRLDKIEESQGPDAIKNAVEDYLEQNPVEVPVQSVNGKTGAVKLTAEDVGAIADETDPNVPDWAKQPTKPSYTAEEVGALPASTVIPTVPENVSAFRNDAGYLTEHQDISGKLDASELPTAINTALAQAKESGEFDGADGAPGKDGADGQPGETGPVGPAGPKGDTGATGAQGPKGEKGDKGDTGPAGPKGDTGEIGPQGPKGPQGEQGPQGIQGATGPTGADGKSAYQYAKEGGYTGTETEFAEKLAEEMPTALPNPNKLTFTGAVNETYDGSAPKSVAIPTVPESLKNPNKLILSGAVTAEYDGSEAVSVEIPSGGSGGKSPVRLIRTVTVPEDITTDTSGVTWLARDNGGYWFGFDTDENGDPFEVTELFIENKNVTYDSGGLYFRLNKGAIPQYGADSVNLIGAYQPKTNGSWQWIHCLDLFSVWFGCCNNGADINKVMAPRYLITESPIHSIKSVYCFLKNASGFGLLTGTIKFYGR